MTAIGTVGLEQEAHSLTNADLYEHTEQRKANLEKVLNILGYIPVISSGSGITRGLYGVIEVIKSFIAVIFVSISDRLVTSENHSVGYRATRHLTYLIHGFENIIRGSIECLPLIINNLAMIAYDLSGHRHEYLVEVIERKTLGNKV